MSSTTETHKSTSETETERLGRSLGQTLSPGDVVLLYGDLGSGKTALSKGIAAAYCGIDPRKATSPTYVLVHRYGGGERILFHVDLYRLDKAEEIRGLGLDELLDQGPMVIEWGEKAEPLQLPVRYKITLESAGDNERHIHVVETGA
ncbi:MAG TPA: tRNA (adenosine(37)-N6)-threonylcarbamoyltransferase complex ATPase subunit type 1 TsaE [Acidobacteriota bacterium]|jgi:tRNA threonylcarbamoyladenosine biosynthesis protein TsaE